MLKKTLTFALVLVLLTGVFAPSALAALPGEGEVKITIVHSNDVHSRVDTEAYVASVANEKKAAGENVLVFSAGDVLHGQPFATISEGLNNMRVMNAVGYDAMVPGNHDFNYGYQRLEALAGGMNFPVLAANVYNQLTKRSEFTPYIIKDIQGVKVGIFGLATPETVTKTNPSNVKYLTFQNPEEVADKVVKELELLGCDVIICLSHLGMDEETMPNERSTGIAQYGIDVIIDGHSHHALPEGLLVGHVDHNVRTDNTLIAQTGSYGENVGVVEITVGAAGVTDKKASLLPIPTEDAPNSKLVPDRNVTALIASLNADIKAITSEVVATTPVLLLGEREIVRTGETNLANLIGDAILYETKADFALTNGGNVRVSLPAGNITKGDVLTVLPFSNIIVTKQVTGQAILDALEWGIQSYPATAGGFPHFAGLSYTFDASKGPGSRLVSVIMANGQELNPNQTYTLATNDFIADGGDGYDMLAAFKGGTSYGSLDEAFIKYLQTNPVIPAGPQGRITVIGNAAAAA